MADDDRPYKVGKGKPPVEGQIKPGERRNPHGRPVGSLNVATILRKNAAERVPYTEGAKRGTVTRVEALVKRWFVLALTSDDYQPIDQLLKRLEHYDQLDRTGAPANSAERRAADLAILKELSRLLTPGDEGGSGDGGED